MKTIKIEVPEDINVVIVRNKNCPEVTVEEVKEKLLINIKIKILKHFRVMKAYDILSLFGVKPFVLLEYDVLEGIDDLYVPSIENMFMDNRDRRIIVRDRFHNKISSVTIGYLDYKNLKEGDIIHIYYRAVFEDVYNVHPELCYEIIKGE